VRADGSQWSSGYGPGLALKHNFTAGARLVLHSAQSIGPLLPCGTPFPHILLPALPRHRPGPTARENVRPLPSSARCITRPAAAPVHLPTAEQMHGAAGTQVHVHTRWVAPTTYASLPMPGQAGPLTDLPSSCTAAGAQLGCRLQYTARRCRRATSCPAVSRARCINTTAAHAHGHRPTKGPPATPAAAAGPCSPPRAPPPLQVRSRCACPAPHL
jgi:hypothetical protein